MRPATMRAYRLAKNTRLDHSGKVRIGLSLSFRTSEARSGIQKFLKLLDSRFRGNDGKMKIRTFSERISFGYLKIRMWNYGPPMAGEFRISTCLPMPFYMRGIQSFRRSKAHRVSHRP
jgi:hypothetical protein